MSPDLDLELERSTSTSMRSFIMADNTTCVLEKSDLDGYVHDFRIKLIQCVETNPYIFNLEDKTEKNEDRLAECWRNVAIRMNFFGPKEMLTEDWTFLAEEYRKRKMTTQRRKNRFPYMKNLAFLEPVYGNTSKPGQCRADDTNF